VEGSHTTTESGQTGGLGSAPVQMMGADCSRKMKVMKYKRRVVSSRFILNVLRVACSRFCLKNEEQCQQQLRLSRPFPRQSDVALAGDFLRKKFLNFFSTPFWMLCSAAVSAACGGARVRGRGVWAGGEDWYSDNGAMKRAMTRDVFVVSPRVFYYGICVSPHNC
jgi:hypothetical protein